MSLSPRRTLMAVTWFPMLTALFAVVGYLKNSGGASAAFFWLALTAIVVAAFQTWVNYSQDWYSPTLALKYQDEFEGATACKARATAAKQFKEHKKYNNETKEIEEVLDIFEDIGFYVMHDEISPEVAHHHFYHWIRGYVQTASEYIDNYRREQPTAYDHCKFLLEQTTAVEAKKMKCDPSTLTLDDKRIASFIDEEAGKGDSKV
jgi:hypothetical protein